MAYMKDSSGRRLDSFVIPERKLAMCDRTFFAPAPVTNSTGAAGLSDGTQTKVTYKIRHKALASAHSIELHYANTKNVAGVETDGDNDITITASIDYPSGTIHPAYNSNGGRSVTIPPGGFGKLEVPISIKAGDYFYEWVCVTVSSLGQKWPMYAFRDTADGKIVGTDNTLTGGTIDGAYSRVYQASAIVGVHEEGYGRAFAIIGDSIGAGFNDLVNASYLAQALTAAGIPYINLSMGSDQPGKWAANATRRRRTPFLQYATHAICEEGINGIGTTWTNAKLFQEQCWDFLNTYYPGRVWQTTIGPQVTTTDSYATTANQTVTANEAVRVQLSDYIRTAPATTPTGKGIAGYFETADVMESTRNSGKWKADGTANKWTNDGTHPSPYAHTQTATSAALAPAALTAALAK